ncbi:MAG: glycosyltransferase family 39 protein [Chthoniobacterales bacterium]
MNIRPTERFALLLIGALLVLRALYLFTHAVDSDEPQNLHVVYQWAKGQLPYRDTFDNHTPLLHALFLPFAGLVGENANVVLLARLFLVPISFGSVWLFYVLCRRLFDRPVALWSVAITLALADWSLKSIEFRPDILWMFCWFAALCVIVRPERRPTTTAFFLAGLLLGAAGASSVKTAFLLPALGLGWAVTWAFSTSFREAYPWPTIVRCSLASILGLAIVPGAIAAFFASQGAFDDMLTCIYAVNKDPFLTERSWIAFVLFPVAFAVTFYLVRPGGLRPGYRGAVFLSAAAFTLAIIGFAPFEALAKQTLLPAYPLLIATACQIALTFRPWSDREVNVGGGIVASALTLAMLVGSPPLADGTAPQREMLAAVLDHTQPTDHVLDRKGETVFRPRPVYLAYVRSTTREMNAGGLEAPDPSRLRETATAYAIEHTSSYTEDMKDHVRENYLSTTGEQLRVAGAILKPSFEDGRWIDRLPIEIPGDYLIIEPDGTTTTHRIESAEPEVFEFPDREQRTLFWKPAYDSGLRPEI